MTDFIDGGARLHVAVQADADRLTLTLTGELDGLSGPPLTDVLNSAVNDNSRHAHVDVEMAQVSFLDLPGLKALLRAHQVCARRGITVLLRDPQPHVLWLLSFTDTAALLLAGATTPADTAARPPADTQRLTPITIGEPPAERPPAGGGGPDLAPQPAATLDEREHRADEREEQADDRERLMQARDQLLDERQQRVSEHQRWEDVREDLDDIRERHLESREHEH